MNSTASRAWLRPANAVPLAAIAIVVAMAAYGTWREMRPNRTRQTTAQPLGAAGGPQTSRADLTRRVRDMEARLNEQPDDAGAALLLADALLRQTRVTGNPGLAVRAETALKKVLRDDPANYDANRMLGALYLSQHRFRDAVNVGEVNRNARPYDPVNYGVIGDAHLELGEYDEAFAAFDRMMTLRPSAASYARVAYARELQGNIDGAIEAMTLAAGATAPSDLEGAAWTQSQLGDLLMQRGRVRDAKTAFMAASHAFPGHPFAVIGYARAIAHEGDVSGALTLLRELVQTSPSPEAFVLSGDLLVQSGKPDEAERQYALAEASWRSDAPEPKNLARFLAEHNRKIPEAVALAEAAARERQDIHTDDALAWAYYKAGRVADAKRAIDAALRTGSRDATIRKHADVIDAASRMAAR